MSLNQYIYLGSVVLAGSIGLWLLLKFITRSKKRRISRLEDMDTLNPISVAAPPGETAAEGLEKAAANIGGRFSIIRQAAIVAITITCLFLLGIPFLGYIPLTAISVALSILGIILGIAARPVIENFIAGVLLSFSSHIRLGDTIIVDGHYGTIEDISMLHTSVKIWNWKRYILSNMDMLNRQMVNFSIRDPYIWAHVEFWVAHGDKLEVVKEEALSAAHAHTAAAFKEDSRFWVMEMGKEGVRCWIAAWASSPAEAWALQHDIRTELVQRLQARGIQTHLYQHQLGPVPN